MIPFSKHACTRRSNDWTSCKVTLYNLYYSVIPLQHSSPKVQFLWLFAELWHSVTILCFEALTWRILCSGRTKRCMTISPGWLIRWTPRLIWLTKYFLWSLDVQSHFKYEYRRCTCFVWDGGFLFLSYLVSTLPGSLVHSSLLSPCLSTGHRN